jgi:hypothetical protein
MKAEMKPYGQYLKVKYLIDMAYGIIVIEPRRDPRSMRWEDNLAKNNKHIGGVSSLY